MGHTLKSQKGQTLLIVVFSMSLGLLVMVNVAGRVLNSIARTTQTNFLQKAESAAEGWAEANAIKTKSELDALKGPCLTSSIMANPAVCQKSYTESRAFIGVEEFPASGAHEVLNIKSEPGETIHVKLDGLDSSVNIITVCWMGNGEANYSISQALYYSINSSGDYAGKRYVHLCKSGVPNCTPATDDFGPTGVLTGDSAYIDNGYTCYTLEPTGTAIALRVSTFPDGARYRIMAHDESSGSLTPKDLPKQGYRIISIGEVLSGEGASSQSLSAKRAVTKKVVVERTFPYPDGPWWDYAITSVSGAVTNN